MPSVAIVLPPREAFSEDACGAIAMVARTQARFGAWPSTVFGRPVARPFADVAFRPVAPRLWPAREAIRHAAGVARMLRAAPTMLIEVHNRPDMALFLARRFPAVSLFLHNDPRGMRGARTEAQRDFLRRRLTVLTVSAWVEERLGAGETVRVLPNGLDLAALPPTAARTDTVLFAGRLVADKGADLFVAAMRRALPRLPGWRAVMLGADRFGENSPETPFLRALRPAAAAAGVTLEGWRPHAAVLAAMAAAAIVVIPGRWPEPFGLVALEAMACGAAIVFVPNGGLPEVVGDAGIAVAAEADSIAEAVLALARAPDRRAALGRAGSARADEFGAGRMAARLDAAREAAWSRRAPAPI